jgi:hypothetical protein
VAKLANQSALDYAVSPFEAENVTLLIQFLSDACYLLEIV